MVDKWCWWNNFVFKTLDDKDKIASLETAVNFLNVHVLFPIHLTSVTPIKSVHHVSESIIGTWLAYRHMHRHTDIRHALLTRLQSAGNNLLLMFSVINVKYEGV